MEKKELAVTSQVDRPLTATEVRKQVNLIQEVMKEVMKENEHYGKVPGCGDKPTLLKPGAEKLAMTFRLSAEYDELPGSTESDTFIGYKINCRLIHILTGKIISNGRGTCNSKEKKYRTRAVYTNKANAEEKAIGKPEKRIGKDGKAYGVLIVPQDPWDMQNTIYKMACKRALVAAVLNATAASDIFTQDIEDLPEGTMIEDELKAHKPPVEMPQEKKKTTKEPENKPAFNGHLITEKQRKMLFAKNTAKGIVEADFKEYLIENYGVDSTKDIQMEWMDDILKEIDAYPEGKMRQPE